MLKLSLKKKKKKHTHTLQENISCLIVHTLQKKINFF